MTRTAILRDYIENVIARMTDAGAARAMHNHLYGVSQAASLIALKRGENAELAAIAGMLHDVAYCRSCDIEPYRVLGVTGDNHACVGAAETKKILDELDILTAEETALVCGAILRHSEKDNIGSSFDEVLKDADIFSHGLFDVALKNFRSSRWNTLCREFGLSNPREHIEPEQA